MTEIRKPLNTIGELGKLPPQSIDVERSLLGAILISKDAHIIASELLRPETFYKIEHRKIYESIVRLSDLDKQIEALNIVDDLKKAGDLESVGGPGYVAGLSNSPSSIDSVEEHCMIIKQYEMERAQIQFGGELIKKAYDSTIDVFETNEFMSDEVYNIQNIGNIKKEISNSDLAIELAKRIEDAKKLGGITGIRTGYKSIDKLTRGLQKGNLIIMAARPGMGKTALALCWALTQMIAGKKVLFFSLEMPAIELFQRLACVWMGIDSNKMSTGDLSEKEWVIFNAKIKNLMAPNLIIVDNLYSISEIRNRTKKERMKGDIDCVYIDYLQICEAPGQSREQQISLISRSFKKLAKEIECPVVALCQLSRSVETRGGTKEPQLSDLRESGAIEQDADIVSFLFRPGYYVKKGEHVDDDATYFIVRKHRNGDLQDIKLKFLHGQTKFIDYHVTNEDDNLPF